MKQKKSNTEDLYPHKIYLDIIRQYQVKGQTAILLTLDLANMILCESGVYLPFANYIPYNQDIDKLLEEASHKSSDEKLESLCKLVLLDIDMVCSSLELDGENFETGFSYITAAGLMKEILKQISKVSPDKYDSLLEYELKGPNVYHYKKLEKIADKAMEAVRKEMMLSFESFLE